MNFPNNLGSALNMDDPNSSKLGNLQSQAIQEKYKQNILAGKLSKVDTHTQKWISL